MRVTITFSTDNDAFYGAQFTPEVQAVLRRAAHFISNGEEPELTLYDTNGNRVGSVEVVE